MTYRIFFILLVLLVKVSITSAQSKWDQTLKLDSAVTMDVVPVDVNKAFVSTFGLTSSTSYTRWLNSSTNWKEIKFQGITGLSQSDYPYILRVAAPNRIYACLQSIIPSDIIVSKDTGASWESLSPKPYAPSSTRAHSFTVSNLTKPAYYSSHDSTFKVSYDGAKTFVSVGDSISRYYIANNSENGIECIGGHDFVHWIIALYNREPPILQPGINTIVTANDGKSWTYNNYRIPGFEGSSIYGGILTIKGTTNVFYIPNSNGGSSALAGIPGTDTRFGISFFLSTDFGKTWVPNYSFGHRRRAFYATSTKDIWMTVSKKDTLLYYDAANWIVHSTDGGVSWDIDSTTLNIQDIGELDGSYLSFFDDKHGWLNANNNGHGYVFKYIDTSKTSVEEIEHSQDYVREVFKIYPNPSSDKVNLLVGADKQILSIRLYNILGKEYIPPYTLSKTNEAVVDLQNVPSGVYLVKLKNQYQYYTLPMVVTKTN